MEPESRNTVWVTLLTRKMTTSKGYYKQNTFIDALKQFLKQQSQEFEEESFVYF